MSVSVLFFVALGLIVCSSDVVSGGATGVGGTEVQVIPNTNLLTGVYYRIGLPDHDFSVLTWADINVPGSSTAKYIQMDDHVDRTHRYVQGGNWYRDGLWFFKPTDKPGFYELRCGGNPNMMLVSSSEKISAEPSTTPPDHYLTYSRTNGSDNEKWEVIPGPGGQTFRLRNYGMKGLAVTTHRFGSFYRWVKVKQQTGEGRSNSCGFETSRFTFKAVKAF